MPRDPAAALLAFWGLLLLERPPALADEAPPPEIADKVELCASCHGADGRPVKADAPNIPPNIWGQEFYYLYVQLRDFQAGRRESELMKSIVADMSKDELQALAKYFSTKPWPRLGFQPDDADTAVAQRMATAGQCTQCHLGAYVGNSRVPRVAGQYKPYLEKTMLDFKNGVRLNAPDMANLLKGFGDDDLKAMSRYLAGLQVNQSAPQ
ncbi:MAG: c-type cytochrome [Inquilinus sp.]|uniref:c-type cytochrome n=1 Tax=Inquilinus sp. TaxID=1932117 RepID=UPI003F3776D4